VVLKELEMVLKPRFGHDGRSREWFESVGFPGLIFFCTLMLLATGTAIHAEEHYGWSNAQIRLLADDCFALIEEDAAGRRVRHCPHHEINGDLSAEQLIFVLGTIGDEIFTDPHNRAIACHHLENHYQKIYHKLMQTDTTTPLNINRAGLLELVSLPRIGPVLAVKVVQYRNSHAGFGSIEEMINVEGIGRGTFKAIRPYIRID
jgi:competence ComEA-like helix-hairpin-helix protein